MIMRQKLGVKDSRRRQKEPRSMKITITLLGVLCLYKRSKLLFCLRHLGVFVAPEEPNLTNSPLVIHFGKLLMYYCENIIKYNNFMTVLMYL